MSLIRKPTYEELQNRILELEARLTEAEETLRAIREGEVDAIIVRGSKGEQVFSLFGAESVYRLIVDTMQESAFTVSLEGKIIYCNAQFGKFLGKHTGQIIGHSLEELVEEDQGSAVHQFLKAAFNKPIRKRLVFKSKEGAALPAHISTNLLDQPDGPSICIVASDLRELENSTELIQQLRTSEEKLRRSERRFKVFFESDMVGTLFWNIEGQITDANEKFLHMLGYTREDLVKGLLNWEQLTPSEFRTADDFALEEVLGKGVNTAYEKEFFRKDGTRIPVILGAAALDEHRYEGIAFALDITESKRTEQELSAAKESAEHAKAEAEAASRAKDHFLAVLSHELRTPLTPVVMGVSMLQRKPDLDPKVRETLEMVRLNVDMEARLIDDLLDVTRIARGKVELNRNQVDLSSVIQRAIEVCMPDIEARRLHFGLDMGPGAPYWIEADTSRLQQVFWNLLKNAIKFTPHDGCVGIRCVPDDNHVSVEIHDSGIGIEPEALSRVFNAFEQAEKSITRQFGGLGLGLAISKALVEMHGGKIEAHSQGKGKGAIFRIQLPLSAPAQESQMKGPVTTPAIARQLRILLVEDHGVTARMMRMVLIEEGHEVEMAGDVATALELADRLPFDLLLSDLGLPDGSGHELMRELRARGFTFPGIALSGYGQEQDIRQSYAAGFNAHLIKPASRKSVLDSVAAVVAENSHKAGSSSKQNPRTPIFNSEEALKRCFGNPKLLNDMIKYFHSDSSELLKKMHSALEDGDISEIGRAAHRLKGSLIYLGAQPAADAAVKVESAADIRAAQQALTYLEDQIEKLKEMLEPRAHPESA